MRTTITTAQANAALNAVREQYATAMAAEMYPEPTLVEDYTESGHPAIVWEEGPYDWPFLIHGGTSEEDHALFAEASAEFGQTMAPPVRPPAKIPTTVFAEPINHIALGLYPA